MFTKAKLYSDPSGELSEELALGRSKEFTDTERDVIEHLNQLLIQ